MIKGDYLNLTKGQLKSKDGIDLYSRKDFDGMHTAGRVAAEILDEIVTSVFPGQTTGKIDSIIEELIRDKNVESGTIGYDIGATSMQVVLVLTMSFATAFQVTKY